MSLIRFANEGDRADVLRLLAASHEAAGLEDGSGMSGLQIPYQEEYAQRQFNLHITHPEYVCLVLTGSLAGAEELPRGVVMASAAEHPFGPVRVAMETVIWVDYDYRGRGGLALIDRYEKWAREKGCSFITIANKPKSLDRYLLRQGYQLSEVHYLKRL